MILYNYLTCKSVQLYCSALLHHQGSNFFLKIPLNDLHLFLRSFSFNFTFFLFFFFFFFFFLLEDPEGKENKTYAAVYDALRIADIVSSSSLQNITGAKIQAVKEVVGEVAFNQGMMATLGRTF